MRISAAETNITHRIHMPATLHKTHKKFNVKINWIWSFSYIVIREQSKITKKINNVKLPTFDGRQFYATKKFYIFKFYVYSPVESNFLRLEIDRSRFLVQ